MIWCGDVFGNFWAHTDTLIWGFSVHMILAIFHQIWSYPRNCFWSEKTHYIWGSTSTEVPVHLTVHTRLFLVSDKSNIWLFLASGVWSDVWVFSWSAGLNWTVSDLRLVQYHTDWDLIWGSSWSAGPHWTVSDWGLRPSSPSLLPWAPTVDTNFLPSINFFSFQRGKGAKWKENMKCFTLLPDPHPPPAKDIEKRFCPKFSYFWYGKKKAKLFGGSPPT